MNNFNERLETYSNFIKKRQGNENLEVIIRELKKFYQLGIDDFYSEAQRRSVIQELIKEGKSRKDNEEKAIFFLFAYKLNKANNFDINIPIIYLNETLIVNDYPKKMPENVLKIFRDKDKELCSKMYEEALPDKEALDIFNVQIIPGYFEWNEISAFLRGEDV